MANTFDLLPIDPLMRILSFLPPEDLQQAALVSKRFLKAIYHDPKEIFKGASENQFEKWRKKAWLLSNIEEVLSKEEIKRTHPLKMVGFFRQINSTYSELDDVLQEEQYAKTVRGIIQAVMRVFGLPVLVIVLTAEYADDKRWLIPAFLLMAGLLCYSFKKHDDRDFYLFYKRWELCAKLREFKTSDYADLTENDDNVRQMLRMV